VLRAAFPWQTPDHDMNDINDLDQNELKNSY
jgi:hypothetical protein